MKNKIGLFLMNRKGFLVLKNLVEDNYHDKICFVESRQDKNVDSDYFKEIKALCIDQDIAFFEKRSENDQLQKAEWKFAIGWRWLIKEIDKLIIIHDSLLPKYRGFAPVVNALINGEKKIGVTALIASESYDRGDIVIQKELNVFYPIKIREAIEEISKLYISCFRELFDMIITGQSFNLVKQDGAEATYSIWRDEEDYYIDWSWPADKIVRFVNAVGFPYKGAKTKHEDMTITIIDCEEVCGLIAEIIHPGKVILFDNNKPIVLCGSGTIKINRMTLNNQDFELIKLKSRFK